MSQALSRDPQQQPLYHEMLSFNTLAASALALLGVCTLHSIKNMLTWQSGRPRLHPRFHLTLPINLNDPNSATVTITGTIENAVAKMDTDYPGWNATFMARTLTPLMEIEMMRSLFKMAPSTAVLTMKAGLTEAPSGTGFNTSVKFLARRRRSWARQLRPCELLVEFHHYLVQQGGFLWKGFRLAGF